jgi:hypothetical protein
MCRVSARRLSFYNFAWELLKATNLQAESKILKNILEHQIYQSKQKISKKKTVFRTLKVERGQKYAWTEFAGPTQNLKKNIGTSNQPFKTKIFPKKVCLVPQMCTGPKNSYGGYPTELAQGTQKTIELKLSSENLNLKRRSV